MLGMKTPTWTLQRFKISDLKDYEKNPRKLTKEQFEQLKISLAKFGLIDKPICTQDGKLIGGHQRKKVLEHLGTEEIECYVPDRELSDKEIEELNVRLNLNQGAFDWDILGNSYEVEDLISWGFNEKDLLGEDSLDSEIKTAGDEEETLKCPKCGHEFDASS